jgi:hypothetical protein
MEILKIFGVFILLNAFFYLIGSFIAFDFNPTHWWIIKNIVGRFGFLFMEFSILATSVKLRD